MIKNHHENGKSVRECEHCGFEKEFGKWNLFSQTPILVDGVIVSDNFGTKSDVFYKYVREFYAVVCGNNYKVMQRIYRNGSGENVVSEVYG